MENLSKSEIIKIIMDDVESELIDEEIIHLILEKKVSEISTISEKNTFGQRSADKLAKFVGSWTFVIGFVIIICIWVSTNIMLATKAFDVYPFILLNLVLSCVAAIQAPLIMMSQNRQEEKDRKRAENDYKVNLKTEIIIQDLHNKLDEILTSQALLLGNIQNEQR
ncbi:MAG: DUF1003 domain-containing protein [Clostridia bacterium]